MLHTRLFTIVDNEALRSGFARLIACMITISFIAVIDLSKADKK